MTRSVVDRSDRYLRLGAVFISNTCAAVAFSILVPTLVVNLERHQQSTFIIGVVTSVWSLPMLVGGSIVSRLIATFSTKRCLAVAISLSTGAVLLFPAFENPVAWIILQLVIGSSFAIFWVITEAWLNLFATEDIRARATALYGILPAVGYAIGGTAGHAIGFDGYAPYLAAGTVMFVSLVPLVFLPTASDELSAGGNSRIWSTARLMKLLLAVAFVAGVFESVPWSLLVVFALGRGVAEASAGLVIAVFFWGQILFGYPLGWLADRVDRRKVLALIGLSTIVLMVILVTWSDSLTIWIVALCLGGVANAIYTIGLALLGQRFHALDLVPASSAFMAVYSAGTLIAPPFVGAMLDWRGPLAFPVTLGIAAAIVALVAGSSIYVTTPRAGVRR